MAPSREQAGRLKRSKSVKSGDRREIDGNKSRRDDRFLTESGSKDTDEARQTTRSCCSSFSSKDDFRTAAVLGHKEILVSRSTGVTELARDMARLRQGTEPVLMCIGPQSFNQAMKAVAAARREIRTSHGGHDISIQPAFRITKQNTSSSPSVAFFIVSCPPVFIDLDDQIGRLPSTKGTSAVNLARTIVDRVLHNEPVHILSVGVSQIANAVCTICQVRCDLERYRLDIRALPAFCEVESFQGGHITAIRFDILVERTG